MNVMISACWRNRSRIGKRWVDDVKAAAESSGEPVEGELSRLLRGIRKVSERARGARRGREAA